MIPMKRYLSILLLLGYCAIGIANNMFVSDVRQVVRNLGAGTTTFSFDLRWDNSWRIEGGANNWDAAWVFVKYRIGNTDWQHLTLQGVESAPTNCQIDLTADTRGAFVYRATPGSGNLAFNDIVLVWDDAADNVPKGAVVTLKVFAIEMVYVPEGPFSLGSNGGLTSEFYQVAADTAVRPPYRVASEAGISVGTAVGDLSYKTSTYGGDILGPIPADYPKGYRAFYCMKYEVTQGQYQAYFNTLTAQQQTTVNPTGGSGKNSQVEVNRNGFTWSGSGDITTSLPSLPMNFVTSATINAYLDWSGLRPLTEFEFEKACRGPIPPVAGEYAWGNASVYGTLFTLANAGTPNEQLTNTDRNGSGVGSASYTTTSPTNATTAGPIRVGIFSATSQSLSREEAGASFYGIMELSGNLYEPIMSAGSPAGRAFRAEHGDGLLTAAGGANVTSWSNEGQAMGARGGSYGTGAVDLTVSHRTYANSLRSGRRDQLAHDKYGLRRARRLLRPAVLLHLDLRAGVCGDYAGWGYGPAGLSGGADGALVTS